MINKKMTDHFNPRSPHRERQRSRRRKNVEQKISIHAPLTGSDKAELAEQVEAAISIHAPLTGSDVIYIQ